MYIFVRFFISPRIRIQKSIRMLLKRELFFGSAGTERRTEVQKPAENTDRELLLLLRKNPDRGMEECVRKYSGLLYHIVRGRLQGAAFSEEDLEDCVADSFCEFWESLGRFDESKGSIKAWLAAIAANNARDLVRKRKNEALSVSIEDDNAAEPASEYSLEGDFETKEQRAELLAAVRSLESPDREIIIRKFYLQQSSKEIAEALSLSVSNVDTRTHRAVRKLRERLSGRK